MGSPTKNILQKMSKAPKMIVFDLDYTLWPFWCDTHITPPLHRENGHVYGADGRRVQTYPDSPTILRMIHEDPRIKLACASRTEASKIANTILRLLDWEKFFDYKEIYPGSKTQHFKVFRELSGIPYEDMLFFDDEDRNTREISRLGVHCCLVPDGMSLDVFERALKQFSQTSN